MNTNKHIRNATFYAHCLQSVDELVLFECFLHFNLILWYPNGCHTCKRRKNGGKEISIVKIWFRESHSVCAHSQNIKTQIITTTTPIKHTHTHTYACIYISVLRMCINVPPPSRVHLFSRFFVYTYSNSDVLIRSFDWKRYKTNE